MRTILAVSLALAAAPSCLGAPELVLSDPKAPLWEVRPLDRHVYILTLDGDWKSKPPWDAEYAIHIVYPDGTDVSQRPPYDRLFRRGVIQCALIQYQYEERHFRPGEKLTVYVSRRMPAGDRDQEVISNRLDVPWPFDRDVVRKPPQTRFSEPGPIDTFHPPGEEPVTPPKPNPPPQDK